MIWRAETRVDGFVRLRIGREGTYLVAEWPGIARLTVDRAGSNPSFVCEPQAPAHVVDKIRNGAVTAMLRHLRGQMSLHAASVSHGSRALAFLGESGAGKSTLATALAHRQFALLSDDMLFVNSDGVALPSETATYLDDGTRRALSGEMHVANAPAPLRWLMALTWGGDRPEIRHLRGIEAARILAQSLVRFVLDEDDVVRSDMNRLAKLAHDVDVLELRRPRGLVHLPEITEIIERAWNSS